MNSVIEPVRRMQQAKQKQLDKTRIRIAALRQTMKHADEQSTGLQKMLSDLGHCSRNEPWVKQGNGYRCSGGGHFVADPGKSKAEHKVVVEPRNTTKEEREAVADPKKARRKGPELAMRPKIPNPTES